MVTQHLSTETLILGPLNVVVLLSMVFFTLIHVGKEQYDRDNRRVHSIIFPYYLRQWGYAASRPIKRLIMRFNLGPNPLTLLGFLFMGLSGLFFGLGLSGVAAWMIAFGGLMDVMDGMVARETKRASKKGAFLDSSLDRYGEILMFLGIVWLFGASIHSLIAILALGGSFVVSYTKARGESLGVTCSKGLLQRPERLLILALGGGFDPILHLVGIQGHWGLIVAVWLVGLFANVTAIQRIVYISGKLDEMG